MPDGGVKLVVKNKMQNSVMNKIVCDDELMVDRVITASQQKGTIALPSYGRSLVPYFVPGCEEPGEEDINVNTDVEALRRRGGSVLQVPLPRFAKDVRAVKICNGPEGRGEGRSIPPRGKGKARGPDGKRPPASRGIPSSCSPLRIGSNKSLVMTEDVSPTSPMDTALLRSSSSDSDSVDSEVVPKDIAVKRAIPSRRRSSRQEHMSCHFLSKSAPGMCYASLMEQAVEGKRVVKKKGRNASFKQVDKTLKNDGDRSGGLSDGNVESSEECGQPVGAFLPPFFPFGYERWAGPSFANSPPPSSLPLPKFPVHKAVSLSAGVIDAAELLERPLASRSSPPSPVGILKASAKMESHEGKNEYISAEDCGVAVVSAELLEKMNLDVSGKAAGLAKRLNMEDSAVEMVLGDESVVATRELRKILQLP